MGGSTHIQRTGGFEFSCRFAPADRRLPRDHHAVLRRGVRRVHQQRRPQRAWRPSMGLSPALVQQNFQIIRDIHATGVSVLMVEQNPAMALSIADRGYVLSTGEIVLEGPASQLLRSEDLKRAYLGR